MRVPLLALACLTTGCISDLPPCSETGMCNVAPEPTLDPQATTSGDDGSPTTGNDGTGGTLPTATGDSGSGARCGDRMVTGDETCDDGNLVNGDGCNEDCQPSLRQLDDVAISGPAGGDDVARAVALADNGDIVVGGTAADAEGTSGFVLGLDPTLDQRWATELDAAIDDASVHDVAVEEDGRVAVTGTIGLDTGQKGAVAYYDADGVQGWGDLLGVGTDADFRGAGYSVSLDNFGVVYVGGFVELLGIEVVRISRYPTNGPPKQANDGITPPMGSQQVAHAVAAYPDGALVYAGVETTAAGTEALVGFHPDGGIAPINYGRTGSAAHGVTLGLDGEIVVVGSLASPPRLWAAGFNASLDPIWDQQFDQLEGTLRDVAVAPDGTFYVIGETVGASGTTDVFVAHLDENGNDLVSVGLDLSGGADIGYGIAVDPTDGTLVAVGSEQVNVGNTDGFVLRLAP